MQSLGKTCFGAVIVLIGIASLATAAKAHSSVTYYVGLSLFALSVLGVFWLIKRSYDAYERDPARPRREVRAPAKTAPAPAAIATPSMAGRLPASVPDRPPFLSPSVRGWIRGGCIGVAAIFGLVAASQSHGNEALYFGGLFFFAICVFALFRLVSGQFDSSGVPTPLLPVPEGVTARCIRGGLLAIVFVLALSVALKSHGAGLGYYGGLIVAGCAVFYIFYLIRMSIGTGIEDGEAQEG